MRNAFSNSLLTLARADDRIILLSGDIGNRMFDGFKAEFPDRFFNCGVAEQNMMGVAAGMALSGLRPVVYTIAAFVVTRCLEQIRVDVCYHEAPVIIVGVGAGLAYANLGATHHACEDIAMLRAIPGLSIVCPGDPIEVSLAMRAACESNTPVYVRLGKKGEPVVHAAKPDFQLGQGIRLSRMSDVMIISTGTTLPLAVATAEQLAAMQISAGVISMHTVKPIDTAMLRATFAASQIVATLEEHSEIGGLGGAVAEYACDFGVNPQKLLRLGTPDHFFSKVGSPQYLREQCGLTPAAVCERIVRHMQAAETDHRGASE